MSLIPWHPFKDLNTLRQQMDTLFDEMVTISHDFPFLPKGDDQIWAPAIEMQESNGNIVVKAQVPGVEAKDLNVEVTEKTVSISGEHQETQRTEEPDFFRSEFKYGRFQRVIPLPKPVKYEEVQSEFKNGLLTLTLPKAQVELPSAVKVNVETGAISRQAITEDRQEQERLQETMRTRAVAELQTPDGGMVQEAARELNTQERQQEEHLQDTMRTRTAAGSVS